MGLVRGWDTAAVGAEGHDAPPIGPDGADQRHGGHVIDPRIEAHLAQQQDPLSLGVKIQIPGRPVPVGDRQHVPSLVDAVPGHQVLKGGGQHVDDDGAALDLRRSQSGVVDVEANGGPPGVVAHAGPGDLDVQVTYGDEDVIGFGVFQ